jgi:predicted secreted protein
MAVASHTGSIEISTASDGTFYEVDGIKSVSFTRNPDIHDITDLKDTSAAHVRAVGLFDSGFSISGESEQGDTNGQVSITTLFTAGSDVHVRFKPNGSAGWRVPCKCVSIKIDSSIGSMVQWSAEFQGNGAVVAV